ncbi:MAG: M67 family metallopeptidase [Elusimicrobia bacterium]|nr:M67 family metallopeptidase [Elusimicrobiota bacterium]
MLMIRPNIVEEILAQARQAAPIEACGYLAEKDGVVVRLHKLTNVDASPEHFSLDPAEQFAAVRAFRSEGLKLRAVYHSHPASPARPSAEDIRLAFDPSLSYVIVSLMDATPVFKSFKIQNGSVEPEEFRHVL